LFKKFYFKVHSEFYHSTFASFQKEIVEYHKPEAFTAWRLTRSSRCLEGVKGTCVRELFRKYGLQLNGSSVFWCCVEGVNTVIKNVETNDSKLTSFLL
jgi:hypothetical protein